MNYFRKVLPKKFVADRETAKLSSIYAMYNGEKETKFVYKDVNHGINAINILKTLKHSNIVSISKYEITNTSCFFKTEELQPFYDVLKISDKIKEIAMTFHALNCLSDVICFLKRCKITHNQISYDSLYIANDGRIILGDFEFSYHNTGNEDDKAFNSLVRQFSDICSNFDGSKLDYHKNTIFMSNYVPYFFDPVKIQKDAGLQAFKNTIPKSTTIDEIIAAMDWDNSDNAGEFSGAMRSIFEKTVYQIFLGFITKWKIYDFPKRQIILDFLAENHFFVFSTLAKRIIDIYISDFDSATKTQIDNMLFLFFAICPDSYADELIERLFVLQNIHIRIFLLTCEKKSGIKIQTRKKDWNTPVFDIVSAGIKCSDNKIQVLTIDFISAVFSKLNRNNQKSVIKDFHAYAKTKDVLDASIVFLEQNIEHIDIKDISTMKHFYKLVVLYITNESSRTRGLNMFKNLFTFFDPKKIQKDAAPMLLYYLSDRENQELCFELLELVIKFLKSHREAILADTLVKGITNALSKLNFTAKTLSQSESRMANSCEGGVKHSLERLQTLKADPIKVLLPQKPTIVNPNKKEPSIEKHLNSKKGFEQTLDPTKKYNDDIWKDDEW